MNQIMEDTSLVKFSRRSDK